ncbi:MAG: glycogen-binding domain-containing protein [Candidatus Omnitrophota bacterium]
MQRALQDHVESVIPATFVLQSPGAQSVYVTGTFNEWSLGESYRMQHDGDGRWALKVPLKAGVHRYRFIVDGKWQEDPNNPLKEKNPFGDINSLIELK